MKPVVPHFGFGQVYSGQNEPKAVPQGDPVTDSAGQAVVDSIKTPMDKAHQVEGTLEKAAEKTADTVKGATQ